MKISKLLFTLSCWVKHSARPIIALALAVSTGCATINAPESGLLPTPPLDNWSSVLKKHVNDQGQVDFETLQNQPAELHTYVNYLANTDPLTEKDAFPTHDAKLAHYINAYNAMAMFAVLEQGIPKTNSGLKKIDFFFLKRYQIANKSQSLHTYEKEIREVGDPRVHFALNCMSVGCPVLPRIPFEANTLQTMLDTEARNFFSNAKNLKIITNQKKIYLSEILKFYEPEFVAIAGSLIGYVNQYIDTEIPEDFDIEFIPYDWTINQS